MSFPSNHFSFYLRKYSIVGTIIIKTTAVDSEEKDMEEIIKIAIESVPKSEFYNIELIKGIFTIIIAVVASFIAWEQRKINNRRLKNETFDRKMNILVELDLFLIDFIIQGMPSHESLNRFYKYIVMSKLFYNKNITYYLLTIFEKGQRSIELHHQLYDGNGNATSLEIEERSKITDEELQILNWVSEQKKNSIDIFIKELSIV